MNFYQHPTEAVIHLDFANEGPHNWCKFLQFPPPKGPHTASLTSFDQLQIDSTIFHYD